MKLHCPSQLKLRLASGLCGALLFGAFSLPSCLQAQTEAKKQDAPSTASRATPVPEDRDALIARLTKMLSYGSELGLGKPSKNDAVAALGVIGDERAVPVLADHLANNDNRFLRLRIVRALGWIGGQQAVAALEKALKDDYPPVRKQAADVLQQITGRAYEYDKSGLPEASELGEEPTAADGKRLQTVADDVAKRRELRQAMSSGSATPLKKKISEPVDIEMVNVPIGDVAKTYSDLTGKLVLVSPKITLAAITCKIEKASLANARAILGKALFEAGVQVVELDRGVVAFTPVTAVKPAEVTSKP